MRLQLSITTVIQEHAKTRCFDSCLYTERLILESNKQLPYHLKFRQLFLYVLVVRVVDTVIFFTVVSQQKTGPRGVGTYHFTIPWHFSG